MAKKAKQGHYEPAKARKYCDGKHHTFLTPAEFETRKLEFRAVSPKGSSESPTKSEEGIYQLFAELDLGDQKGAVPDQPEAKRESTPGPRAFFKSESSPIGKAKKPVGKVKMEKVVLGGSPLAKVLQEAGVLEEEIPQSTMALMGMMDKMTDVLNRLADREVTPVPTKAGRSVSPGDVRLKPAP
jgi:hypothetical protein